MEYAILGGGALGLGAAYRLSQAGHSAMVFPTLPSLTLTLLYLLRSVPRTQRANPT